MPGLPSRNDTFVIAVKNYAGVPVKFCSISLLLSKYFVHDCSDI